MENVKENLQREQAVREHIEREWEKRNESEQNFETILASVYSRS